jgi:hypothetical protein
MKTMTVLRKARGQGFTVGRVEAVELRRRVSATHNFVRKFSIRSAIRSKSDWLYGGERVDSICLEWSGWNSITDNSGQAGLGLLPEGSAA